MKYIFEYLFGPSLYKFYAQSGQEGRLYVPNTAEKYASLLLRWMNIGYSLSTWFAPLITLFCYRYEMYTTAGLISIGKYSIYIFILWASAILTRGFGRYLNVDYRYLINVLREIKRGDIQGMDKLRDLDCSFECWPIDYIVTNPTPKIVNKEDAISFPMRLMAYLCVEIFGRRLLYPGSLSIIQYSMQYALIDGREKLVKMKNGRRCKIQTSGKNYIDAMFVDKRNNNESPKESILVVCSEGNAGFYEVGCMETPLTAGYSVLGWNHPGFGGSTGKPTIEQEQQAIDSIMQFAINRLNFSTDNIILFAWSIGGYAASFAAALYPDIRAVILDATFDDIRTLATDRMPPSWGGLVNAAISLHLNLNNADLLNRYSGPLVLVRREMDEIICIKQGVISTNRGNFLLTKILKNRYPNVFDRATEALLEKWLSLRGKELDDYYSQLSINEDRFLELVRSQNPLNLGVGLVDDTRAKLVIYLAKKYMRHFDSTHCQPLPSTMFLEPWKP